MSRRILVTGASGFVGTHLVRALVEHGEDVYASTFRNGSNLTEFIPEDHIMSGDLTSSPFTLNLVKEIKPDVVYNLAALSIVHSSVERAGEVLSSNLILQYNLLESIRLHAPTAKFIAICSANEYGYVEPGDIPITEKAPFRPLNPYAVSKISQDMLALQYHLAYEMDVVRLRPFNHTGVGQTTDFVIPYLAKQFAEIKRGQREPVIKVGNLDSVRDFTDVRDMVQAYLLAAEKCESGEAYNIGYGKGIKVREIISLLEELSGVKIKIETKEERVRKSDVPVLISDSSKFRGITGWEPKIKFKDTLNWIYNSFYKE